jgi:MOSC domain-containing protein YiiM
MPLKNQLLGINIGEERLLNLGPKPSRTGIFKLPVQTVEVTSLGCAGDRIVSEKHHGGPDQAVYVYTQPDYDQWESLEKLKLAPGTFGENLLVSGLDSAAGVIGDRLIFKDVILEVSAPRIPCATLAARMGDPKFVKMFVKMERPGFYCRVIKEGKLSVGESFTYEPTSGPQVTIGDLYKDHYANAPEQERIKLFLSVPIAIRIRKKMELRLKI